MNDFKEFVVNKSTLLVLAFRGDNYSNYRVVPWNFIK